MTVDTKQLRSVAEELGGKDWAPATFEAWKLLLNAADEIDALRDQIVLARDALVSASTDIREWLQIAEYQRAVLDHDKTPCPRTLGIDMSRSVLDQIASALKEIR